MLTDALLESANAGVNPKVNPHPNVKAVTVVTSAAFKKSLIIYNKV